MQIIFTLLSVALASPVDSSLAKRDAPLVVIQRQMDKGQTGGSFGCFGFPAAGNDRIKEILQLTPGTGVKFYRQTNCKQLIGNAIFTSTGLLPDEFQMTDIQSLRLVPLSGANNAPGQGQNGQWNGQGQNGQWNGQGQNGQWNGNSYGSSYEDTEEWDSGNGGNNNGYNNGQWNGQGQNGQGQNGQWNGQGQNGQWNGNQGGSLIVKFELQQTRVETGGSIGCFGINAVNPNHIKQVLQIPTGFQITFYKGFNCQKQDLIQNVVQTQPGWVDNQVANADILSIRLKPIGTSQRFSEPAKMQHDSLEYHQY
ncbi:hypothetical protein HDV06_000230 [Boothiomyces sp. JEL0866]|nr:hypothetical protein HDV06_000230 [Boothiomyces sp. JEL0866]